MSSFSWATERRDASASLLRSRAGRAAGPSRPPEALALPAAVGNQALHQLLGAGVLRPKLAVSHPGDPAERQADQVADRVMRKCSGCQEEGEEKIQRKAAGDGMSPVTAALPGGAGRPLPQAARAFFEPRFGRDFGDVRIHADAPAADAARTVGARAFTLGRDIAFDRGEYAPETTTGRTLLAHELAHVVQGDGPGPPALRRQVPHYSHCTPAVMGPNNDTFWLDFSRQRAVDWVDAALGLLPAAPAPGSAYETALARHFRTPSAAQRTSMAARYVNIRANLAAPGNFRCELQGHCHNARTQAQWEPGDDRIHVCRHFWDVSPHCGAIVLIHEAAHDAGVDVAGTHRPNRGEARYPLGDAPPAPAQTAGQRLNNCDAFAFFAQHVRSGSDLDETCF